MAADELRDLKADELQERLEDAREEMMNLRFRAATGELSDTNQLRITRRLIARLLTVLKEKEGEGEGEA